MAEAGGLGVGGTCWLVADISGSTGARLRGYSSGLCSRGRRGTCCMQGETSCDACDHEQEKTSFCHHAQWACTACGQANIGRASKPLYCPAPVSPPPPAPLPPRSSTTARGSAGCLLGVTVERATDVGFRVAIETWRPGHTLTWHFDRTVKVSRSWGPVRSLVGEGRAITFALSHIGSSSVPPSYSDDHGGTRHDQWGFALENPYRGKVQVSCVGAPVNAAAVEAAAPPPVVSNGLLACPLGATYYTQVDSKGGVTALVAFRRWRPGASVIMQYPEPVGGGIGVHDVQHVRRGTLLEKHHQQLHFKLATGNEPAASNPLGSGSLNTWADLLTGGGGGRGGGGGAPEQPPEGFLPPSTFSFRASGLQASHVPLSILCPEFNPMPPPPPPPPPKVPPLPPPPPPPPPSPSPHPHHPPTPPPRYPPPIHPPTPPPRHPPPPKPRPPPPPSPHPPLPNWPSPPLALANPIAAALPWAFIGAALSTAAIAMWYRRDQIEGQRHSRRSLIAETLPLNDWWGGGGDDHGGRAIADEYDDDDGSEAGRAAPMPTSVASILAKWEAKAGDRQSLD